MTSKTTTQRPAVRRNARLAKRMATYTAAATAAAATAVSDNDAYADIEYNVEDVMLFESTPGLGIVGQFDLDDDGTIDLEFGHQQFSSGYGAAIVGPGNGLTDALDSTDNRIAGTMASGFFYAQNVAFDTLIDSTLPNLSPAGTSSNADLAYGFALSCPSCEFTAPTEGFIGVSFNTTEGMKYGWVRVNVSEDGLNKLTVLDYAYNNTAGGSIRAGQVPEPGSLGLLALGGVGLMSWRRRRKNQESNPR